MRPPNSLHRQNLSRYLTSVEQAGLHDVIRAKYSVTQRSTKNAHELLAREKYVKNVYVKSKVVSVLNPLAPEFSLKF